MVKALVERRRTGCGLVGDHLPVFGRLVKNSLRFATRKEPKSNPNCAGSVSDSSKLQLLHTPLSESERERTAISLLFAFTQHNANGTKYLICQHYLPVHLSISGQQPASHANPLISFDSTDSRSCVTKQF